MIPIDFRVRNKGQGQSDLTFESGFILIIIEWQALKMAKLE